MRYYLETFGCQMNLSDSEIIRGMLEDSGHRPTESPGDADIILLNTCSVREHAEVRAIGRLTDLYRYRKYGQGKVLGMLGCIAQHHGQDSDALPSWIDIVLGPDNYRDLPRLIEGIVDSRLRKYRHTRLDRGEFYGEIRPRRMGKASAWIQVMRGCDRFCSYCIVPYVRGRERSRDVDGILEEVISAAKDGIPEVVLIGQNVNAYSFQGIDFADLLRQVARVPGIHRVRFLTSHPVNFTEKLLSTMKDHPSICKSLHLPLQSGSGRILTAMNRGYTIEEYLEKVRGLRREIPEVSLSTDLMVGFPGETEEDFGKTLDAVREVEFDHAFMFRYSPRRGTKAAKSPDQVDSEIASVRLSRLISIQKGITEKKNWKMVGSVVRVLVEGRARRGGGMVLARTEGYKKVVFKGNGEKPGSFQCVEIVGSTGATLIGERARRKGSSG